MSGPVALGGAPLCAADYEAVVHEGRAVELANAARIDAHRAALESRLMQGATIYSVNTGYGADAGVAIPPDALARLQENTLRSHAVGVGPPVDAAVVRGMLLLIAQSGAQGFPGARREVVEAYVRALNSDGAPPLVPALGSHSASDLVPAAHLALAVLDGVEIQAKDATVLNNAAFSAALAYEAVREADGLVLAAEAIAAMTLEAVGGFPEAFDARLVALRPHPGALECAAHMRALLAGSTIVRRARRPHDPFSLRCIAQVHGAVRDQLAAARLAVEIELSSVSDNPVVLADGDVLSGGLFHGEPIALPLDGVSLAVGELATLSAARARQLVAGGLGPPAKLTAESGGRLGLLMLPAVAAALVSECRQRGAPASRESVPVDAMEDHVSMAALAARQARECVLLARRVLALELACAAQALDFAGVSGASPAARALHADVRARLAFVDADVPIDSSVLLDLTTRAGVSS
jgi:histidine ammonia-lyase